LGIYANLAVYAVYFLLGFKDTILQKLLIYFSLYVSIEISEIFQNVL